MKFLGVQIIFQIIEIVFFTMVTNYINQRENLLEQKWKCIMYGINLI